jgi:ABC-type amino acid transport substrate-binding protein
MGKTFFRLICALGIQVATGWFVLAGDLEDVKARGVLRHLGVPYANFVSGAGDGMDVEIIQRFAKHLGVRYEYVPTEWGTVVPDLIGRNFKVSSGNVDFLGEVPVKGDLIANGLTMLPWRQKVVAFSKPTFPSQIWLIARSDSKVRPIKPTGDLEKDIEKTRTLMEGKSVLSLEKTCLDPSLYNLAASGAQVVCFKGKLNELAPALLHKDAEMTILDVPDALIALEKWRGKLKILGPITGQQEMGAGFPKDAPKLQAAFNAFLEKIQKDGTYDQIVRKYYPTAPRFFPAFFKR